MAHYRTASAITYRTEPPARGQPRQYVAVLQCVVCEAEDTIRLSNNLPEDVILNKFKERNWVINQRGTNPICPNCNKKEKPAVQRDRGHRHNPDDSPFAALKDKIKPPAPQPTASNDVLFGTRTAMHTPAPVADEQPPTPAAAFDPMIEQRNSAERPVQPQYGIAHRKLTVVFEATSEYEKDGVKLRQRVQRLAFGRPRSPLEINELLSCVDMLHIEGRRWIIASTTLEIDGDGAEPRRLIVQIMLADPDRDNTFVPLLHERFGWHMLGHAMPVPTPIVIPDRWTKEPDDFAKGINGQRMHAVLEYVKEHFPDNKFTSADLPNNFDGMGMTESTIRKVLRMLVDYGHLSRESASVGGGTYNMYRLAKS